MSHVFLTRCVATHNNVCFLFLQDTIRYSVIDGSEAIEYFYLNPSTGLISINKFIYKVGQDVDQVGLYNFATSSIKFYVCLICVNC